MASTNALGPDVKGTPYDAAINAAAHKYNVRPALLAGLIKQESGFDPTLVSPAGAEGLAQLMPGTAKSLGVTNPFDAAQSIDGGAKYLSQQLQRYGGNETEALAAYNAGPGAVDKYGGVPPYAETQAYVKAVEANAAVYGGGVAPQATAPHAAAPHAAAPHASPAPAGPSTLAEGSRGSNVVTLQRELGVKPDGIFGPKTESAVREFQKTHGLAADGVVGPNTRVALERDVARVQRELGVTADGKFGPKTESALRDFQKTHGLDVSGVADDRTLAALQRRTDPEVAHTGPAAAPAPAPATHPNPIPAPTGHAPNGHVPPAHPAAAPHAGAPAAGQTAMQTFEKTWEANASVNPRTGATTYPPLSATLDQKNKTLEFQFRDRTGAVQSATMHVGETSASNARYDATDILPGKYQLGNFDWNAKGAATQGLSASFGAADIPVNMRDGHDAVPVVLKHGHHVSDGQMYDPAHPDPRADGTTERLHGGGGGLAKPFEPHQPITVTNGCVRGENEDVTVVAGMLAKSGKPIALTITRDTQSPNHEVQRSSDGGKSWQDVTNQTKIVGRLHDAPNSELVSIVTRSGQPPQTISFKPEQLGFTKQQIEEIAARDPKGQISIGIDQFHQPVVNAAVDLARSQEVARPVAAAQR